MRAAALVAVVVALALSPASAKETALTAILDGLATVGRLRPFESGKVYEVAARGEKLSGRNDDFLRRRTPEEILASGYSCGCGDYAFAFYRLMKQKGFEVRYIDAAALTYKSVLDHFDGHTAVAVKEGGSGNWILVDPTFGKIISGDWDPGSKLYIGPAGSYWIGYRGALEEYPVRGPQQLKEFYSRTLATVPKDVWDSELRLRFVAGKTMAARPNPRLPRFLESVETVYRTVSLDPARPVLVTLEDGGDRPSEDGGDTSCAKDQEGRWSCTISRKAGMSPGLIDWIARQVRRAP